jgi:hypothetical protein
VIAPDVARHAAEALWLGMIELAETANDLVVSQQPKAHAQDAQRIAACASDLAVLANAASVLARHAGAGP